MNVETAIRNGAKQLGYEDLKDKQMEAKCSFLNGTMFLFPFQLGLGKQSSMLLYLLRLIHSEVG